MSSPRKFRPGEPFLTTEEAVRAIVDGEWIYHRHKPTHPGWAMGWSLSLIKGFVGQGYLRRAVLTEHGLAMRAREKELETA
jgi:hypothetical protein